MTTGVTESLCVMYESIRFVSIIRIIHLCNVWLVIWPLKWLKVVKIDQMTVFKVEINNHSLPYILIDGILAIYIIKWVTDRF